MDPITPDDLSASQTISEIHGKIFDMVLRSLPYNGLADVEVNGVPSHPVDVKMDPEKGMVIDMEETFWSAELRDSPDGHKHQFLTYDELVAIMIEAGGHY